MQRRNRWIFLLMGCVGVMNGLVRVFQAEYAGLFSVFVASIWFWFAYRPPQIRSRVWQWGMYLLAVLAIFVILSSVYDLFA